ncbi:hypothetical protein [Dyadobacter psychrotolerans]|jgi:hypothetical protein|uniref:Uncharacterized protein n=1 Tax=Dyadobacter psychrotolerans TaxID=2541721 RepID=A0A4R5DD59_9BACT|nr:hypothetical protein [Dyadobacter psychrotolerans]TDE09771.1 hypothetical protein E0F88_29715 [Dyadobacter psychrotolerans]
MIFLGLIKANDPTSLIDPVDFRTVDELYEYLLKALDSHNFSLSVPVTKELLEDGLKMEKPLIINFAGSTVSFMLGEKEVIYSNTSRFVNTGLELSDAFTKL